MRQTGSRGTVMVIAQDEPLLRALDELLASAGYVVRTAPTASEAARALARASAHTIVLLDPLLPGSRPAAVLRAIGDRPLVTLPLSLSNSSDGPVKRLIAPEALLDLIDHSLRTRRTRAA